MPNEAARILGNYARRLDDEDFEGWLNLFSEESYYSVIQHEEFAKGSNFVIVGEKKEKLRQRVLAAAEEDHRRSTHLLTGIEAENDSAIANFALLKDGALVFSGRYLVEFSNGNGATKINRFTVVLDNAIVEDVVFMPI
jgi:3-phenylpropionate/cinnamic acid dioxygenase small subunit